MKVEYRKRFLKDLSEIPNSARKTIETFVFSELPNLGALGSSGKIERLTGYPGYFKVRFGEYRVGLRLEGDTIFVERVLHRREIYRYYP